MSRTVLLTCLGTGDYVPVYYQIGYCPRSKRPEKYVQVAIARDTGHEFTHAVVLLTLKAREMHFQELDAQLRENLPGLVVVPVDIEEGRSLDELWAIFQKLGNALEGGDTVVMDLTHGFRSLPATLLLALQFFTNVKGVAVKGVYYGAFEALGSPREVKARNETNPEDNVAPIFDLSEMFVLPAWSAAVATWKTTGRAEGLITLIEKHTGALRKQYQARAPQALVQIPQHLSLLDDALALLRHDRIAPTTKEVLEKLDEAMEQAEAHVHLTPFRALTTQLRESVAPIASDGSSWERAEDGYLCQQARVARWYADRGRLMEAFSFLRELITSCAVRVARNAGCVTVVVQQGEGRKECGSDDARFRSKADGTMRAISWPKGSGKAMEADDSDMFTKMKAWCDARPSIPEADREARQKTEDHRNKLDHCWTGREHSQPRFNRETRRSFEDRFREAHEAVEKLVAAVIRAEPEVPRGEPERRAPKGLGGFANLSNHPAHTWSEAQREAARALGHGEVVELPKTMPLFDPEMDTTEVVRIADDLAEEVVRMGVSGAFVATEFVASYALVRALHARGVRCYTATTLRETTEDQVDGASYKKSVFRFVRWRAYPC
jgi:CRISPR-associated Csx2 family protein